LFRMSSFLRGARCGRAVRLMSDSLSELKRIQGPFRHAWWLFWVRLQGWFFSRSLRGSGPWSPSWVAGHVSAQLARLERWTR
jgi:hypothetical protein